ncbi:MAG: hypothetical protein HY666_03600 [Chloroflexi bacterium]|nr:hypothetical protein [Chloroflexota bacterium]
MARLTLSYFIKASPEEVYEFVTAFGKDGPVNQETFDKRYGKLMSREGDAFIVKEEISRGGESEHVVWRCTFRYPQHRLMEAVDSLWADRLDQFRTARSGTYWRIQWRTKTGGIRGVLQYLFFRLIGYREPRRNIIKPVQRHFEETQA